MTPSDEFLLTQYKQGDPLAFRQLVDRYTPAIFNLARRLLFDPMEAENVTQDTFLRMVTSLDRLHLDMPVKPYIFKIAVNLCHDLARKKRPALFSDLEQAPLSDETLVDLVPDSAPLPWEQVEAKELEQQLRAAIDALAPPYQTIIVLRYTEEMSYEEIAQILGLPLNTVRSQLRRAKQQLRRLLENE